jgi:hypothetical protein
MNYKKVSLPLKLLLAASLAIAEVSGSGAQNVGSQTTGATAQKEVVISTSTVKAKKKKAVKKAVKKQEGQKNRTTTKSRRNSNKIKTW